MFVILTVRVGFLPPTTKNIKESVYPNVQGDICVKAFLSGTLWHTSHSQECNKCADRQMIRKHITSGHDK